MPYRILFLLLLAVGCVGCSSVHTVSPSGEAQASYAALNRAVRGKVARVTFHRGEAVTVASLHVGPDSLTWVDQRRNQLRTAPTANVREVTIVKAGRGAVTGLLVGAVVGAGIGTARAYVQGDDPASDPIGLRLEQKLYTFPIAHALYAMLVSTPAGAIVGVHERYRFPSPAAPPAGPPALPVSAKR